MIMYDIFKRTLIAFSSSPVVIFSYPKTLQIDTVYLTASE